VGPAAHLKATIGICVIKAGLVAGDREFAALDKEVNFMWLARA
jgi:hypothetical protein